MKKTWIKPVVLGVIFIGALITFSIVTNKNNKDLTTKMAEATLPVMQFYDGDIAINELHGYVQEMDTASMRDSILPVGKDRMLNLSMSTYGASIDTISYEIRSMDGERLVADGRIEDFTKSGQVLTAKVQLQNILNEDEEYTVTFTVNEADAPIYYYTRIMQTTDLYTDECLKFAVDFHNKTFEDNTDNYFLNYIEAQTGDSTNLSYVNLNSSIKQLRWANFDGKPASDLDISFKEINDYYNVVIIKYVLSSVSDSGENEYYNVEEYFRLRQTDAQMYVLNYERTMNQIFRGENDFIYDKDKIQLGIRENDVEYETSEAGDTVAFVQNGALWSYDVNNHVLSQVFNYRGAEGVDERENYDQHDIKIVRIDEAGSVDFIVYGYMNRGNHEGEVGLGVYHYDGLAHTVEEEAFIPSIHSYQIVKAEMGQLMYENDQSQIFLMLEGTVYQINLDDLSVETKISGLKDGEYSISGTNRYLAWVDQESQYSSQKIHLMDLKTGKSQDIQENEGEYVKPLGFIDEDFIYGIANATEVFVDAAGNTAFPMKMLKIMDTSEGSNEILKEYTPASNYIGDIQVENYTITVNLIANSNGQYIAAGTDAIMNREADTNTTASIVTSVGDIRQTEVQIQLKEEPDTSKVRMITPKEVMNEKNPLVNLELQQNAERYYVYARGEVTLATDSISEAILKANTDLGMVLGNKQQYVWMRARKNYQSAFSDIAPSEFDSNANSIVKCISAMLVREGNGISISDLITQGYTPKQALENTLKDATILDLTGCTSDEIIYYVSCQKPVFAMTSSNSAVLVTGYSAQNISYYDPDSRSTKVISTDDAKALFANAGNIFFTYIEK